ncbi:MAG: type II toxin-antitoxin system YafQ family toxin [Bifidobacteriaceae bacterium]|uniref:type II toxin-antitoxin system YafQ family toxin n=1 Tax=Bifidobacterium pseudocatenulatum TaxID=28026 RepID=UPI001F10931B|nr:type II toxin-antitoxin system YafQ family toxin [Bifidobacterium pseudocatenulatum]MCH4844415.1 type II toxin-antitoxin system YafQ family toxin [Bifidobacterium pseudocatenulatum]MDO5763756.1 type II toxin-antitoxin system YafQ family toxin [Bifidobacteriaceae bacterium]
MKEVIRLVAEDTDTAKETLRRRHRAHRLQGGDWDGAIECHVGNAGNWLAIWIKEDGTAWFLRTGTHAEILGR